MWNNAVFFTVYANTVVKNCVQLLCCIIVLKYYVKTVNPDNVFNTANHPAKQHVDAQKTVQ